ncbi:hypothetical protein SEA_TAPIOCA_23 [Mycobacterium phage Tapioca]|uniref:Uncharacterized protein n=14 Tax=Caudoviricetes TaxID=2731619 RepID=G1FTW1_9CAUD|nr:hypothetical protein CL81_gp23 [Mycobacterium phage Charlie]YP_009197148.1 hypothetical protein AVV74_gp23 [Mycobacterium phage Carcharodon]YP_009616876.1 hypothetical protein FDI84_gp23 [Mycobacterium phage Pipsqueaks]YP_010051887.1 hypothetical protein KD928_gp23 [Mycobacterium phage Philonius]YP_010051959.1 hypothetical protein KD929_gp23 [Mycobacterium phage Aggie]YP_010052296.1 hypothetical protein KD934_gp23 [Mycobacterium phage Tapioca]YP_010754815.1 hypothetical protein QEH38_gp26 
MNAQLEAIRDAMNKDTGQGRDIDLARALADAYVTEHPDQFANLADMPIEQCVAAVDVFRSAGMEDDQWRVEAWLLHRFEPQTIGGPVTARIRVPGQEN